MDGLPDHREKPTGSRKGYSQHFISTIAAIDMDQLMPENKAQLLLRIAALRQHYPDAPAKDTNRKRGRHMGRNHKRIVHIDAARLLLFLSPKIYCVGVRLPGI